VTDYWQLATKVQAPALGLLLEPCNAEDLQVAITSDSDPASQLNLQQHVFFKVIHANPGQQKVQIVAPGVYQPLRSRHLAVSVHKIVSVESAAADAVHLHAQAEEVTEDNSTTLILDSDVLLGCRKALLTYFMSWDIMTKPVHMLCGFSSLSHLASVRKIIEAGAYPGSGKHVHFPLGSDLEAAAESAAQAQLLVRDEIGWQLTLEGQGSLQMLYVLHEPRCLDDVKLSTKSLFCC
jgi:hypothetical protein